MSQIKVTSYMGNPIQDIPNPWMYGLPSGSFADMIPLRFSLTVPYWQRLYFILQIFLFLLFFRQSETGHLQYTIPIRRSARSFAGNHTRPYRVGRRTSRTNSGHCAGEIMPRITSPQRQPTKPASGLGEKPNLRDASHAANSSRMESPPDGISPSPRHKLPQGSNTRSTAAQAALFPSGRTRRVYSFSREGFRFASIQTRR